MSIIKTDDAHILASFSTRRDQLTILQRERPAQAAAFFQTLEHTPFRVIGRVPKNNSASSIRRFLGGIISENLKADPFYDIWIADMAAQCQLFCEALGSKAVGFCLGTERGCRRYHIDKVPMRCLVTYSGQGTEWIPDTAADRMAFSMGAPNAEIVIDPAQRQFIAPWHVAIFRGGENGLLHRTPDSALNGPSILMRLDHADFWDKVFEHQQNKRPALVLNG